MLDQNKAQIKTSEAIKYAVIVAAGSGIRAGSPLPKQFHDLAGIPVFMHSVQNFLAVDSNTNIIIVCHPDFYTFVEAQMKKMGTAINWKIVFGGTTRWESVKKGLEIIPQLSKETLVAVHDAARPLTPVDVIERGWECAAMHKAAVPVVPVTDSLRKHTADGSVSVDRSLYVAVQTPQVFEFELLKKAYCRPYDVAFTDDASVVENIGYKVSLFEGSSVNMKITNPADFAIANTLIGK